MVGNSPPDEDLLGDAKYTAACCAGAFGECTLTLGSTTVGSCDVSALPDVNAWPDTDSDCGTFGRADGLATRSMISARSAYSQASCDVESDSDIEGSSSSALASCFRVPVTPAIQDISCTPGEQTTLPYTDAALGCVPLPSWQFFPLNNNGAQPMLKTIPTPAGSDSTRSESSASVCGRVLQRASQIAGSVPQPMHCIVSHHGVSMPVTTLMIRNVPDAVDQSQLMDELNRSGFAGLYDFCYLPRSFDTRGSRGYAFVNMVTEASAARLQIVWHRQSRFGDMLTVSEAELQGFAANVQKWAGPRLRRVKDPRHHPFIVEHASGHAHNKAAFEPRTLRLDDHISEAAPTVGESLGHTRLSSEVGSQEAARATRRRTRRSKRHSQVSQTL